MGIIPSEREEIKPGYVVSDRLTVIGMPFSTLLSTKKRKKMAVCECKCGKVCVVQFYRLLARTTKSCGCLQRDKSTKHGHSPAGTPTSLYRRWKGIRNRCGNPNNPSYKDYGGRGIRVCREWNDSFDEFAKWAMENGYQEHLTIERNNVNGNYEPRNCCWATTKEQSRNRQDSKRLTIFGETKCTAQWAEDVRCRVSLPALYLRLARGWDPEKAVTTQLLRIRKKRKAEQ